MGKYLAIYNGAASDGQKAAMTADQQQAFMDAWGEWATANAAALVDPGSPLFRKRRVTRSGVTDFEDSKTGYAIVAADSHDDAVAIFATHPHLRLLDANSIEVLECPEVPG